MSVAVRVVPILAALALAACTDLTKYQTEGTTLLAEYAPKLAQLTSDNAGLLAKLQALPAEFPGVKDLLGKVTANQTQLTALQGEVSGFASKLADAVKGGDEKTVKGLIDGLKTSVGGGITSLGTGMKALSTSVTELETKAAEAAKAAPAAPSAAEYAKQLADGYALKANVGGIEDGLITFIEDAKKPVDKTTWFDFDQLLFKTGKAELDLDKSKHQLENVAEILKVFPKVKLKVGGYTDSDGDDKANLALSNARAKEVAKNLTAMGIDAKRLDPEGYGEQHPVCPANDTDECKAKNRRISVRVTEK